MGSAFVATLLSGMEDMPPTVLVLDDFQLLSNTALLGEFDSIVEHAPPSLRLLLSTRVDPALRYHRLLVRDEVAELRQGDLAFDRADAERLIALIARCRLNDEQIDTLVARTEGWAAGLQLAALFVARLSGRRSVRQDVCRRRPPRGRLPDRTGAQSPVAGDAAVPAPDVRARPDERLIVRSHDGRS